MCFGEAQLPSMQFFRRLDYTGAHASFHSTYEVWDLSGPLFPNPKSHASWDAELSVCLGPIHGQHVAGSALELPVRVDGGEGITTQNGAKFLGKGRWYLERKGPIFLGFYHLHAKSLEPTFCTGLKNCKFYGPILLISCYIYIASYILQIYLKMILVVVLSGLCLACQKLELDLATN